MKRHHGMTAALALVLGVLAPLSVARADVEVAAPDGRRVLLKNDGTWRYVETAAPDATADKPAETGEAVLTLERRTEVGPNCRFEFRLVNNLPYEIHNIVPFFSVYRADGVLYESRSAGFVSMKPGNTQNRSVLFQGITCPEIARLQVTGGDRCEMGELNRFTPGTGMCLARVRVVASNIVRFEK